MFADSISIDERPVCASQVANPKGVLVKQQDAVVSADLSAVQPQVAVRFTTDQ